MGLAQTWDATTIAQLEAGGSVKWSKFPDAIGAFIAEMDFGLAAPIADALQQAIRSGPLGYLPDWLTNEMTQACAQWQADRYGWRVSAEQIHPVPDVIEGLRVAITRFSTPDAPVIVPTPAYMPFLSMPPTLGRDVIEVPLTKTDDSDENSPYTFDLDGLARAFEAGGNLLVLCNPYNPVGRVFTRQELLAVSDVVAAYDGRVFADEIHAPLIYPGAHHLPYASISPQTRQQAITATSASKAWNLPGLKCAQLIITNDADAAIWDDVGFWPSHGTSNLGVIANTAAYRCGGPWLDEVIDYLDGNRRHFAELIADQLPAVGYQPPEGTYIGWLDWRRLDLGAVPADFVHTHARVAMTDGADCGVAGRGCTRFVLATPRPILDESVRRMASAVGGLRQSMV
jgi:cystathionine beta-lyase